jgi:hypothetical protein
VVAPYFDEKNKVFSCQLIVNCTYVQQIAHTCSHQSWPVSNYYSIGHSRSCELVLLVRPNHFYQKKATTPELSYYYLFYSEIFSLHSPPCTYVGEYIHANLVITRHLISWVTRAHLYLAITCTPTTCIA